ncbi:MAG TPA: patatin [Zetaproteobacteria bacterium]|nr:patatin [Zetaproteobacteria bacterium]
MGESTRIGLALGSGAARGWGHIGVIRALARHGIRPHIVCGCSMGALIGAAYAARNLDGLAQWAAKLSNRQVLRLMDFSLSSGGLIQGERLMDELASFVADESIESLAIPFAAVATDLDSGAEICMAEGSLSQAVRASTALPGLFAPVCRDGVWLVDGGLVNPVPVSVCRELGADVVIGVNLNTGIAGTRARFAGRETRLSLSLPENEFFQRISEGLAPFRERMQEWLPDEDDGPRRPGLFEVVAGSIDIMQDRITQQRLREDKPDVLIEPHLGHMGIMEFDRAGEAMEEGEAAVEALAKAGGLKLFG